MSPPPDDAGQANVGNPYISGNAARRFDSVLGRFLAFQRRNLFMRNFIKGAVALGMISGWTAAGLAANAPTPTVSLAKARAMALKLAPGKIISSEYEKEGGIWRYSFDIQQRGHVQEIGIDGRTGKVVENKSEGKVDHD
jgi:hypothetical protein